MKENIATRVKKYISLLFNPTYCLFLISSSSFPEHIVDRTTFLWAS